jgi:hypothetical protein
VKQYNNLESGITYPHFLTTMSLIFWVCIFFVAIDIWTDLFIAQKDQSSPQHTAAQNSDPKQTIVRYYNLAPNDRRAAINLLSDPWRREAAKNVNDNWWSSVRQVEVYAFQTFAKNNSKAKIKIWLKYYMKNGETPCESLIFNLVFDRQKSTWLMDSVEPNSVIQKPYCDAE